MRDTNPILATMLAGSFERRLIVDIFHGTTRKLVDVPCQDDWSLSWDTSSDLKADGSLTLVYSDEYATSITPQSFTDAVAPYGQEANLLLELQAAGSIETVQLGHYRIRAVPEARDQHFKHLGRTVVAGSIVKLDLADRQLGVQRRGFRTDQNPQEVNCWNELARITGMQLRRNLTDTPVPTDLIYKATNGGRQDAVKALAAALGGTPYTTPDGALTVIPDVWGAPVGTLEIGENGTLLDLAYLMDSDEVYNAVVGDFEDAERNPIHVEAELTAGALAINGLFGEHTYFHSGGEVASYAAAQAIVDALLTQLSGRQTYRAPFSAVLNPLYEIGDVVRVQRKVGGDLIGRIAKLTISSSGSMSGELDVYRNAS